MMKVSGKIVGANIDFRTGKPTISFEINEKNDFKLMVDELKECEKLSIEVKPWRKKRSLDANAYCWVLIDKLSERLGESKESIYRKYIRDLGVMRLASRISELRKNGVLIEDKMITVKNRFEEECRVKRYSLKKGKENESERKID